MRNRPDDPLLDAISRVVSWTLRFDPETLDALSKLDGRIVAIELLGIGKTVYVLPGPDSVRLQGVCTTPTDVTIAGKPIDLLSLARQEEVTHTGAVTITGDLVIAREFEAVLKNLNIDWEEIVSLATGDFFAHKLGNVARGLRAWVLDSQATLERDVSEYLRYEQQLVPQPRELERFFGSVDRLRDDVERLEKRLNRVTVRDHRSSGQ